MTLVLIFDLDLDLNYQERFLFSPQIMQMMVMEYLCKDRQSIMIGDRLQLMN